MQFLWIVIYLLFTVGGIIFIKSGADSVRINVNDHLLNVSMGWQSIVGYCCYLVSFALYTFKLLRDYSLSYIVPISMGASQVLILLAAYFFFKEKPEYCPACVKKISQGML